MIKKGETGVVMETNLFSDDKRYVLFVEGVEFE